MLDIIQPRRDILFVEKMNNNVKAPEERPVKTYLQTGRFSEATDMLQKALNNNVLIAGKTDEQPTAKCY